MWLLHWAEIRIYSNLMKDAVYRSKFCQSYCDLWYSRYWNKHAHRQALSAGCVRKSDDSRNSAIRIAYRISLRSSSSWEPRYPSLKIFLVFYGLVILGLENRFNNVLEFCINTSLRTLIEQILGFGFVLMILPQVHLRKPCYDFYFL